MNKSRFSRCLLAIAVAISATASPAFAADPPNGALGLGGSSRLTPDTVLPFSPGTSMRYASSTFIQNTGSRPLTIKMTSNVPVGITVEPLTKMPFSLKPGEGRTVPFAIIGGKGLADGTFDSIITLGGSVEGPLPPGTTFLPGFSTFFRIKVVGGDAAKVTVRAVNSDDGKPAVGQLSLYYLGETGGGNTFLDSIEGSELVKDVPAGRYRAEFRIEGLTTQDQEFSVVAGEQKTVEISIKGVTFLVTTAKPRGSGGKVDAARLTMSVRNNLRRFVGPVTFDVAVKRNGEKVEDFRLAQLPELPEGISEQQTNYVPPGGFKSGKWTFEFSLTTPEYTVRASEIPSINVPRSFGWLWLGLTALGIGGGAGVLYVILGRKRFFDLLLGLRKRIREAFRR